MKKFKYSLENVLKYKEDIEGNIKENYLKLKNRIDEEEEILNDLSFKLSNNQSKINENTNIDGLVFKNSYLYIYTLQERIEKQERLIYEYNLKLEEVRQKLIYAQKERKTIELLREKSYQNYIKQAENEEQKIIDELGLYAFMRKAKI